MKIVGIIGYAGSGKGTVSDIFTENSNWKKFAYADPLKDAVSALFGWPRDLLEGDTAESREFRENVDDRWSELLSMTGLTPRIVLQQFGSEVIRGAFHDSFWVKCMESRLSLEQLAETPKNIVIPDCRFSNEAESIRSGGGVIVKVKNPFLVMTKSHNHVSESSHVTIVPNYIIWNIGTLEELKEKTRVLRDYIEKGFSCVSQSLENPETIFEEYNPYNGSFLGITKEMIYLKQRDKG